MGLDMYAFVVEKSDENTVFSHPESAKTTEIAYWRKFNALHGWMNDLAIARASEVGVDIGDFNCVNLKLSKEDIDSLEDDLENNKLQPRVGFFFGPQEIAEYHVEQLKEFISAAKSSLDDGYDVYYTSWF